MQLSENPLRPKFGEHPFHALGWIGAIIERLRDGVAEMELTKWRYPSHCPFPPSGVVEHFRTYYGPTNRAGLLPRCRGLSGLR